jgi:hypothetical protein
MKVLWFVTYQNPKSDEGLKKYYDYGKETREYRHERLKKFNVRRSGWSDGSGKMYYMYEFENYDAYAKYMDDEKIQRIWINTFRTVNNVEMKVLRGSISAPPKS